MDEFAQGVSLTKQTRASFDAYLRRLPQLLHNHDIVVKKFDMSGEKWLRVQMDGCKIEAPKVLESDGSSNPLNIRTCRLRNLTYNIPIYTTIHIHRSDGPSTSHKNVYLGRIPLMVGSKHCNSELPEYDPGGYFICNGSEKTIINQKAHVHNTMMTLHRVANNVDQWAVCCKSESGETGVMSTTIRYVADGTAMVLFPKVRNEVSISELFAALPVPTFVNLTEDECDFFGICEHTGVPAIQVVNTFCTGADQRTKQQRVLEMLLPHTKSKSDYLVLMLRKLRNDITVHHWDDKDSLFYQRIEMCEDLLFSLTHNLLCKMKHDISMFLHRKMGGNIRDSTVLKSIGRSTVVMDGIQYALSTGNWRTNAFDGRARTGVAQLLQRATIYTALSQMRRVSSSIKPEQKLSLPRYIHGTHRGRLCYVETPEGASCGLESQLAVGAYISIAYPTDIVCQLVRYHLTSHGKLVFVNGSPIGFGDQSVVNVIRAARRSGQIAKDVSVADSEYICIRCNSGRICRPLIILPRRIKSFQEMLDQGLMEYVDAYEENTLLVSPEGTHVELDSTILMGLCAATIPYSNCNPAPRNTYQAAMMKQAQSVPTIDYRDRWDTTCNVIHYGQKPLVTTGVERAYNYNLPMGQNCIVAIMPAEYNQEDSTIWNQGSIDRGIGRTTTFKTVKDTLGSDESYGKPVPKRRATYEVSDSGMPDLNHVVATGDCLIGKIRRSRVGNKMEDADVSVFAPTAGTVDSVLRYRERDGTPGTKVKIRKQRVPEVGDKFASRSAQKGTIGLIVPQEDMPFTLSGIVPDVILNPHALPSRMTMAQMLESVKSKYACFNGLQDGSPFNGDTAESVGELLHSIGFSSGGTEVMVDGRTGQRYKVPIFIGPTFYQRLKHNSADKMHARARGRLDLITRQPNEGRASGGGLRVGEMEKDSFVAHGVPYVLNERLLHASDAYKIEVCSCGLSHSLHDGVCQSCGGVGHTKTIPYGFHLLIQELQSMCVNIRLT